MIINHLQIFLLPIKGFTKPFFYYFFSSFQLKGKALHTTLCT